MSDAVNDKPDARFSPTAKHVRMMRSLTVASDGPNVPTPSRWIPVPAIPVRPVLSAGTFSVVPSRSVPSVVDTGHAVYVAAGRVAIGLALKLMDLSDGDNVLVPAFHCISMIEPLSWVSATPNFYRIREDLTIDMDDLAQKVDSKTRVLMATHYFGMPQDLVELRRFCDSHDLFLLEDCAHSFFGEHAGHPLGSYGDYAIASLTKFFPVREGGCLVSRDPQVRTIPLQKPGFTISLFEGLSSIEDSVYCNRLGIIRPLVRILDWIRDASRSQTAKRTTEGPALPRSGIPDSLDIGWMYVGASGMSSLLSRLVSRKCIATKRRRFFDRMAASFSGHTGCRPIINKLTDGMVPYMFPLWIDNLSAVFPKLEDRAVPMQRFGQFLWNGVDETVCPNSFAFSKHLIQLPCHQELRDDEVAWIIDTVSEVIAGNHAR